MPKENVEKTKSARNFRAPVLVGAVVVLSAVGFFGAREAINPEADPPAPSVAIIGGKALKLEIADSPDEQIQGLSGRESLAKDSGMLFVFAQPEVQCFWMKDMRINIDMTWLDESGKVQLIEDDVSPDTYPKQFCPDEPSKYVLETNAGVMKSLDAKVGQQIELDLR
jgi:uncharacterized membrane protein (UPF0127 family)